MRSEATVVLVSWRVWKGSIYYINLDLQFKYSIYFSRRFFIVQIRRRNLDIWLVKVCLI